MITIYDIKQDINVYCINFFFWYKTMLILLNVYYIQKKYWAAPQWIKNELAWIF